MNINRSTIIALLLNLSTLALNAQQIPNANFEAWDTINTPNEKYVVPHYWKKLSGVSEQISIERSLLSDIFNGNNSLMLFNDSRQFNPSSITTTFSFDQRPETLSFWSKTKNFNDKPFRVGVVLFNKTGATVATAIYDADTNYFKRMENRYIETLIDLSYQSNEKPDSATITITSGLEDNYPYSSLLYLDSFSFSKTQVSNINALSLNNLWKIVPNPANTGEVNIVLDEGLPTNNMVVSLRDVQGRQLWEQKIVQLAENRQIKIYNASMPAGIYYVTLQMDGTSSTQKLILVH
jgi:hypothetical protein